MTLSKASPQLQIIHIKYLTVWSLLFLVKSLNVFLGEVYVARLLLNFIISLVLIFLLFIFFFFKWKNKCAVLLFGILYNQHNYNPHFWKNVAFHSALIRSAFGGCYLSCFVAVIIVFNILLSHQKKQTAITSHRHNTTMQRSSRAASSVDYHFDCSIIWIYLYLFHSQSSPTQINTKAFPMFNP